MASEGKMKKIPAGTPTTCSTRSGSTTCTEKQLRESLASMEKRSRKQVGEESDDETGDVLSPASLSFDARLRAPESGTSRQGSKASPARGDAPYGRSPATDVESPTRVRSAAKTPETLRRGEQSLEEERLQRLARAARIAALQAELKQLNEEDAWDRERPVVAAAPPLGRDEYRRGGSHDGERGSRADGGYVDDGGHIGRDGGYGGLSSGHSRDGGGDYGGGYDRGNDGGGGGRSFSDGSGGGGGSCTYSDGSGGGGGSVRGSLRGRCFGAPVMGRQGPWDDARAGVPAETHLAQPCRLHQSGALGGSSRGGCPAADEEGHRGGHESGSVEWVGHTPDEHVAAAAERNAQERGADALKDSAASARPKVGPISGSMRKSLTNLGIVHTKGISM
jgi:hypothetical protein